MALAIMLAGCSAPPRSAAVDKSATDPIGAVPDDFSIDLTILTGSPRLIDPRVPPPPPREVHHRPSRYIVLADGSLHYGADERRGADWRPGFARRLDRQQMSDLWLLLRQSGLAAPAAGEPPRNNALIEADRDELVYLLTVKRGGERWMVHREIPMDGDLEIPLTTLIQRLAELAWVDPEREERPLIVPERYDFGPDPYARYRQTGANDTPQSPMMNE